MNKTNKYKELKRNLIIALVISVFLIINLHIYKTRINESWEFINILFYMGLINCILVFMVFFIYWGANVINIYINYKKSGNSIFYNKSGYTIKQQQNIFNELLNQTQSIGEIATILQTSLKKTHNASLNELIKVITIKTKDLVNELMIYKEALKEMEDKNNE